MMQLHDHENELHIASLTIAYNGEAILPQHILALQKQSVPLAEIILVNNASRDGTLRLLTEQFPNVTVLNLPTNAGVGGGYAAGLEYAINQKGYNWVWLLDQDSVAQPGALQELLEARQRLGDAGDRVAILAPVCVHENTQKLYPGLQWRNGWRNIPVDPYKDITFVDAVISSGSLLSSDAVRDAGLPRSDFFIDYVDLEHCLRLRSKGYTIAVVRNSILHHSQGTPRVVRFAGFSRVWADHVPWREYYKARNEVFTVWGYHPGFAAKFSVVRRLLRHALGILLFGQHKLECLKMMLLGIRDGRAGKLGIRSFSESEVSPSVTG